MTKIKEVIKHDNDSVYNYVHNFNKYTEIQKWNNTVTKPKQYQKYDKNIIIPYKN